LRLLRQRPHNAVTAAAVVVVRWAAVATALAAEVAVVRASAAGAVPAWAAAAEQVHRAWAAAVVPVWDQALARTCVVTAVPAGAVAPSLANAKVGTCKATGEAAVGITMAITTIIVAAIGVRESHSASAGTITATDMARMPTATSASWSVCGTCARMDA
jgi:hypothetical protein